MSEACNIIKKETLAQLFSCEFCEISKNTFFTKHLWVTASENLKFSYHIGVTSCDQAFMFIIVILSGYGFEFFPACFHVIFVCIGSVELQSVWQKP